MWYIITIIGVVLLIVFGRKRQDSPQESKKFPLSEKERVLIEECRELADCSAHHMCSSKYESLFNTVRNRLEDVQQREAQKEAAQQAIELEHFKMVKSMELFNLLCQMIMQNPILAEKLRQAKEDNAVFLLRGMFGFTDQQFENNKQLLLQVVKLVKTGEVVCNH